MSAVTLAAPGPANLPQIAGYYSQLAGVLAGFSFAGLVALVTTRRGATELNAPIRHSVAPLTSAFIALVASSLDYALVTGELAGTPRVSSLQTIAGMGFSIAGIMLVYSILVLLSDLRDYAGTAPIGLLRNLVVFILPSLLVLLMWGGLRDHLGQKYATSDFVTADWIALGALAVTVATTGGLKFFPYRPRDDQSEQATALANVAALLAFLSLFGSAILIAFTPADTVIPDAVPVSAMLLVAGFSVATAHSASCYRTSLEPQQEPAAQEAAGNGVESNASRAGDPPASAQNHDPVGVESNASMGGGGPVSAQNHDAVLEELDHPTLIRRSVEIFPQAYLSNISIIQGVALSVMTVETVNFLKDADPDLILPSLAQSALGLAALIIVSYEYLWFTTVMRWTPTFRDTAIPVMLGVGEIIPPLLLDRTSAWWIAFAVFAMLGAAAFFNTVTRLQPEMFPHHPASYKAIRRLLHRLSIISVVTSCAAMAVAVLVDRQPKHGAAISMASACLIILLSIVTIIGYSESVLNGVYADYRVGRRPPMFERLRTVLRRDQARSPGISPVIPPQGGPLPPERGSLPDGKGQPSDDGTTR